MDQNFYYHISDEPVETQLDSYRRAKAVVADQLKEYHLFDALSHVEFYEQGIVMTPVAVTSTVSDFIGRRRTCGLIIPGSSPLLTQTA